LKIVAILQARMGSTRLPNKVMKIILGKPMIQIQLDRMSMAKKVDQIVLATSEDQRNIPLISFINKLGYEHYSGSENDVLDRYYQAAKKFSADVILRITGDCPLIDGQMIDELIADFQSKKVDYLSNNHPPTFPDGLDIEIFKFSTLELTAERAISRYDREHVTPYMYKNDFFKKAIYSSSEDLSSYRWTVDEPEDFEVIQNVFEYFEPQIDFSWKDVLRLQKVCPDLFSVNKLINRNEGALMTNGQKLWKRAKKVIPGGNMLLSKRPDMFLPDFWPCYFSKSKGCVVWDLDGNEFIDMSIMGIGTNILGYSHDAVDSAVRHVIDSGNMTTLNCPEEVLLAEKLVEIHPWADMVRFARTGGEANAIAVRIARAASGRDGVAICGYHGWHDWYLAVNLGNDNGLNGHLLPGLSPNGVPQHLKNTVFTFNYNNFEELKALVEKNNIGVIMMEVMRNMEPQNDFLKKVRDLATEKNIVLVFDECTSGFRETYGGLHKKYGVEPDMAMFGKALGNGYAINAILGKREIMEAAQSTFISSTFWTERIGPAAALKTLAIMEDIRSWEIISDTGQKIRNEWQALADKYHLPITHWGIPALAGFSFESERALAYKTLITQEMLSKGFLAGNCVYACIAHTEKILEDYFNALDPIFCQISKCEEGEDVMKLLKGPICHNGFKRLN
jgi:glutamate-1-semialdehyde 2,1-aminomutase